MRSPGSTLIAEMVPALGDLISISIFIASRMRTVSSAWILVPTGVTMRMTVPGKGVVMGSPPPAAGAGAGAGAGAAAGAGAGAGAAGAAAGAAGAGAGAAPLAACTA